MCNHRISTSVIQCVSVETWMFIVNAWYPGTVSKEPCRSAGRWGPVMLGSGPTEFTKVDSKITYCMFWIDPNSCFHSWISLYGGKNEYDGEEEFWVTTKESGKKTETTSYEEIRQQEKEAIIFRNHQFDNLLFVCVTLIKSLKASLWRGFGCSNLWPAGWQVWHAGRQQG